MRTLRAIWHVLRRVTRDVVIQNYSEYCSGKPSRRALVSYINQPLLQPRRLRDRAMFSPFGIAQEIPRALNELGYAVDIVNFNNLGWQPRRTYDLFVGHGSINFERLAHAVGTDATKVYFASGLHWLEWNRREQQRIAEVRRRIGIHLPAERMALAAEERAYAAADGILHLGNSKAAETYRLFQNVYGINNACYPVEWAGWKTKDYAAGRQHFLFFEGPGNVHKGLDLLIEAFAAMPELHLHVCQSIQPEFAAAYHCLIANAPNIHIHNFIRPRSATFYRLASTCNWAISASCAEGQPGSLIETMAHGLIPIIPESANIDLDVNGIPLVSCSIEQIVAACAVACELSSSECRARAAALVAQGRDKYSVTRFRGMFQDAVQAIIRARLKGAAPEAASEVSDSTLVRN